MSLVIAAQLLVWKWFGSRSTLSYSGRIFGVSRKGRQRIFEKERGREIKGVLAGGGGSAAA